VRETSFLEALENTKNPVGFLYTSDQLVAQAATYTTQQIYINALSGIRSCDFRNQGGVTYVSDYMATGIDQDIFT
jgi:hypothetical protein